jgi:glyceraldehyde 3-phosphate dehydrogenase
MVMKLGINGFGRIGRLVTRAALDNPDALVVAVNDPFLSPDYAAYLLKHDSVHGKYDKEISYDDTHLIVGDIKIRFFCERNPAGKFPSREFERNMSVLTAKPSPAAKKSCRGQSC